MLQRRTLPSQPSSAAAGQIAVHIAASSADDEGSSGKAHPAVRGRALPLPSYGRLIVGGVFLFFAWCEARRFFRSRCYLIDWSAGTERTSVPVVHTQAELDVYIKAHTPALLRGALRGWPAVGKWTPAFFGRELGGERVEIFFWGRSGTDWRKTRAYDLQLSEYARLLNT